MAKKLKRRIAKSFVLFALIFALLGSMMAFGVSKNAYNALAAETDGSDSAQKYYSAYSSFQEEQDAAARLNEEIEGEGLVLLKNRDNALPLRSTETDVSLFGIGGASPSYGAQGSGTNKASAYQHQVTAVEGLENAGLNVYKALTEHYAGISANDADPDTALAAYESGYTIYGDAAIIDLCAGICDVGAIQS